MSLTFMVLAVLAVLTALAVVLHRNPVMSGLFLVLHLLVIAGLFVTLNAIFLAALQVLIYAGAIVVLIIFVIMLLNLTPEARGGPGVVSMVLAFIFGGGFVWLLARALDPSAARASEDDRMVEGFGSIASVAEALFSTYFYPFEVVSLALVAAMVGALVLAKRSLES